MQPTTELPPSNGVVISALDFGEYDRIIRIMTLDYGKIACIVKNCRGAKRKGPELFDHGQVAVRASRSGSLYKLLPETALSSYRGLDEKFFRIVVAGFLVEVVDHLTHDENEQDGIVLPLLEKSLLFAAHAEDTPQALREGFHSAVSICSTLGFFNFSDMAASPKALAGMVREIQNVSRRPFKTLSALSTLIKQTRGEA